MCSVSRARADSSPLPQAFNRFVISAGRAWMDGPFSRGPSKNIPETWPVLGGDCRLYRWKRANLFQKQGVQMKGVSMKRTLSLSAVALAFFLIAPTMYGQAIHLRLRFHVPFSFSFNYPTFSPGDSELAQQSLFRLKLANHNTNDS